MVRLVKRSEKKAGLPPGTPIYVGEASEEPVRITAIAYDEHQLSEQQLVDTEPGLPARETPTVSWINVDGLQDVAPIETIAERFGLHPLALEDIVHTDQRPKAEEYDGSLFIVLRMLSYNEAAQAVDDEQVSVMLGPGWVLSFQERAGDVFDGVRDRIRHHKGRIRRAGADYLAYCLIDAIVDQYFVVLERLGGRVEALDAEMLERPDPELLAEIRELKRELLYLRRSIWPLRELLSDLQRQGSSLFEEQTLLYLRDVYDHTIQVIDTVETYRDLTSGLLDVYLSAASHRMNEVMKVLTMIATIFIPLSFVAGLYGMNFAYMPELSWRYGYFAVLGVMAAIAAGMVVYFKRKHWF